MNFVLRSFAHAFFFCEIFLYMSSLTELWLKSIESSRFDDDELWKGIYLFLNWSMVFDGPKECADLQVSDGLQWSPTFRWSKWNFNWKYGLDNSKIFGDTSISDGLVCLLVVCHICEWQRLIIAGDWINVCGWTECRDLGRADVYFQALTAGPWFIQCLHTAKQIEQSHQKLPYNMLACQISLNRTRTDSLTSVSQMVLGCSPKTLRKYFLARSLSMKLNIII